VGIYRFLSTMQVPHVRLQCCRDGPAPIPMSRCEEVLAPTPGDAHRHHSTAPAAGRPSLSPISINVVLWYKEVDHAPPLSMAFTSLLPNGEIASGCQSGYQRNSVTCNEASHTVGDSIANPWDLTTVR
jgi:hypothetical protein